MELANMPSIYKRSESLRSQVDACSCSAYTKRTSSNAARGLASGPKNYPRTPYMVRPCTAFRPLSHPNFRFSTPF